MNVFINADDFGLSNGTNRNILRAFDEGVLTGASILANGHAFDAAVREYRKRPGFTLTVHVNLYEGFPVAPVKDVPLLVGRDGQLNGSFLKLFMRHLLASPSRRAEMVRQIRIEVAAQIAKVKAVLHPGAKLRVDSHQHLHMLPFIFRVIADLTATLRIDHVRIPDEPLFLFSEDKGAWSKYFGPNLLKHLLLKWLSRGARKTARASGLSFCDSFVGVLFTGSMTTGVARAAIDSLKNKTGEVELLFHPGKPDEDERRLWSSRADLQNYYFDVWRERELGALLDPNFRSFLRNNESLSRHR